MATLMNAVVDGLDGAAPSSMWATLLSGPGKPPARLHVPVPMPRTHDLLLRVLACGLAEADRTLIDGLVSVARYPIIPGHEVVGEVVGMGHHAHGFSVGDRVGVSRLGWACGKCQACLRGSEHLCRLARLTGFTQDGGVAEYMRADYRFSVHLPSGPPASALAPLLGEGGTAYRALRVVGEAQRIGFYGSAGATRLAAALAGLRGREALIRQGGSSTAADLDAALVFSPATDLVRDALEAVVDGGLVAWVSEIPDDPVGIAAPLPTRERRVRSVAGATRRDIADLVALVTASPVEPAREIFPMSEAEQAVARLRTGRAAGGVVLVS